MARISGYVDIADPQIVDKVFLSNRQGNATIDDVVDAAGAVMNSDPSTAAMGFVIDEDSMATNSPTKVPTQQSVKAYVDAAGPGASTASPGWLVVASSEATAAVIASADFVCDGTADQVQINLAIDAAAALVARSGITGALQSGRVVLSGGRFNCSGSVLGQTGVVLGGMGPLTELRAVSLTAVTGSGTAPGLIKLFDQDVHLFTVQDMWISGNFASGGTCHGIVFDAGGSQSEYPDTNPDADNTIKDCYIQGFTTGTRHGIYVLDDTRGVQISNLQMRQFSGNAIWASSSADSHINNVHIGTVTGTGVLIDSGNWKITNVKTYYCDVLGMDFNNSRMVGSCLEVQDCLSGIDFGASDVNVEGILIDNCDVNGIVIAASRVNLSFAMLHRTGGRYANMNVGVLFSGTPAGVNIRGTINNTDITTPVSGTTSGSANFIRISHGTTLVSVG